MSKKIERYVVQLTMPGLVLALVLKSMCYAVRLTSSLCDFIVFCLRSCFCRSNIVHKKSTPFDYCMNLTALNASI